MIRVPTVLILGAGASAHCGYPLGRQLVADICRITIQDLAAAHLPSEWTRNHTAEFITRLRYTDPPSIDAFLERHPEDIRLGKYLIARELRKREVLRDLFPPNDAGWYRYLYDKLLDSGLAAIGDNRLVILTFNYDRSLEAYLCQRLEASHSSQLVHGSSFEIIHSAVPIIHLHGILGNVAKWPYGWGNGGAAESDEGITLEMSRQIQIIHEVKDASGFCSESFRKANECLVQAERIYFLGFGFHNDNMRRFQFFTGDSVEGKTIAATAHSLDRIEREDLMKSITPFGLRTEMLANCSANEFFRHAVSLE